MGRRAVVVLTGVVAATGAAALVLQVVWQRVLALRTGIDLISTSLTVTAFLAGLGVGSAIGGVVADRLGRAACARAYAGVVLATGICAIVSVPVLATLVPQGVGVAAEAVVTFLVLLVPTTLMGSSGPLLLRAVVPDPSAAGRTLGLLTSVNTLGGAAGALIGGWVLIGTYGAQVAALVAAAVDVAAGVTVLLAVRPGGAEALEHAGAPAAVPEPVAPAGREPGAARPAPAGARRPAVGVWFGVVAVTGAVAIGFETVCFRLVDSMIRSNSYTFPGVLAMWLGLFAVGAFAGSRAVGRVRSPRNWFLGIQVGVATSIAAGLVLLVRVLPRTPLWPTLAAWFNSDGLAGGFGGIRAVPVLVVAVLLPLLVMGPPVVLMGAALPFVQQVVTGDLEHLGRRAGWLGAANLAGNVVGGLLTSLVLLEHLGTGGAARVLVGVLLLAVLVAAVASGTFLAGASGSVGPSARLRLLGAAVVPVALLAVMPTTHDIWTFLHDGRSVSMVVEEDRTCGSVAKAFPDGQVQLHINGASQNGYPHDEFHIALGLVPTLLSPRPERVLVVGFGIGSTTAGVLADARARRVTTAELCGGNERIVRRLGGATRPGLAEVLADPRQANRVEDGRAVLHEQAAPLDLVVTDTVRTTSAASGNTYSVEYYELIRSRLAPGGLMATWVPTGRVLASVQTVFPHVVLGHTEGYNGSRLVVASRSPIRLDRAQVARRLATARVPADRRNQVADVLSTLTDRCDPTLPPVVDEDLNRDLLARDEYFVNHEVRGDPRRLRCPDDLPRR